MAKGTLDLKALMDAEGIRMVAPEGPGLYKVQGPDGSEGTLDLNSLAKAEGLNLSDLDVAYNDPSSPVAISPISAADRAAMALGNKRGGLSYLKDKFEEVKYINDGFVVKNQGIWQQIDPSGLGKGDAWERTQELMRDAADLVDVAIDTGAGIAGATAGAVGGLPGMAVGAAKAGAAASLVKTSLGRAFGTYEASPLEQLTDAGIEATLNAAGTFIIPGAKATLSQLAKSVSKLKNTPVITGLGNLVKEGMGRTTGAGIEATETLFSKPERVLAKSLVFERQAGRTPSKVMQLTGQEDLRRANALLGDARGALGKRYGEAMRQLTNEAKDTGLTLNNLELEYGFMQKLEKQGLGKLQNGKFVPTSLTEAQERAINNQATVALGEEDRQVLTKAINEIRKELNSQKTFYNEQAAAAALQTRKVANDIFRSYIDATPSGPLKTALSQASAKFREALTEPFYSPKLKKPLGEALERTSSVYESYADTVRSAEKLISQGDNGAQVFANQLLSKNPASGQSRKALAEELVDLIGPHAQHHIDEMRVNHAVRAFTNKLGSGGSLPGLLSTVTGAMGSPRAARAIVTRSNALSKWMQGLGEQGRQQVVRDAQASQVIVQMLANSADEEEQLTQQLTQMGLGQ